MNILLINPYCLDPRLQDYDIKVPPIGLYYIGARLIEEGHSCEILNLYDMQGRQREIQEAVSSRQPDLIGISILHANRWGGIDIARIAKTTAPDLPIVFGGPGATFLWRHLLTHFPEIDYIVTGEGEKCMSDMIELLQEGRRDAISSLPGVACRVDGQCIKNDPAPFIEELDSLPDPSRHFSFQHVISSRGCPWNCAFCGSPRIWKRRVRFHSPNYFVSQLQRLHKKGSINFFYVSDDTFTLNKQRVIDICQLILEKKLEINWAAISRVNHVDEEILYWMRKAGCMQISFGVESGSKKIRKALNKELTNKQIKEAFDMASSYGIMPRAYFIYGSPGENKKTIKESIRLIERIRPLSAIFYILDIFPGTALYDDFKKRTGADDDIWLNRIEDIMYFETDPAISKDAVLEFGKRLRKAFYRGLPKFADNIRLVDQQELYPLHADFLSRLAMTFAFGDYSQNKDIPNPKAVAKRLFKRALKLYPDSRAYLGLAMLHQRTGNHFEVIKLLEEAMRIFPESVELQLCYGLSLMNTGKTEEALEIFLKNSSSQQSLEYARYCAQHLGRRDLVESLTNKLQNLSQGQVPQ